MKKKEGKKIDTGKRMMTALLTLCLVLTASGINTMADITDAVSENSAVSETADAGEEDATWSYILFGSYPQSEVTDKGMKKVIDKAIEAKGLTSEGEGVDVSVNQKKYRRISKSDCSNPDYFDNVENNGYRYFEWEPVRWRVLKNDGTTLLAMADMVVDCKAYNVVNTEVTWETCTLRSWLNDVFYRTVFNSKEQKAVALQKVVNNGGNDTMDNVWLLSVEEVMDTAYGFSDSDAGSTGRMLKTSDYAGAKGVQEAANGSGKFGWWLRTQGNSSNEAAVVKSDGSLSKDSNSVDNKDNGVVPVLYIRADSGLWSEDTPKNPVHHHEQGYDTTWDHVYFGSYPQGEVMDTQLKEAIDNAIAESGAESYGEGIDVWVNGMKYRRISKDDCTYTSNFDNVQNNGYRYFKWERVKWRVLGNDGSTLFVAADTAMDCKYYNDESTQEAVAWEACTLRNWLNGIFYRTAFDSLEQQAVATQMVENNMTDNIRLLSNEEVVNNAYGFCSDNQYSRGSRNMKISDYACARGGEVHGNDEEKEYGFWWLMDNRKVFWDGSIREKNYGGVYRSVVVPALHIELSSNVWCTKNDGGSGSGGGNDEDAGTLFNPVHYHDARTYGNRDTTKWSYVYFGSYPQSEVSDEATKQAIDSAISQGKGQKAGSGENSEGTDVWINKIKYRRIGRDDCNNDKNFGAENDGYRYFKWERIKWRVLKNDGNTLFIAADRAMDCKDYSGEQTEIIWETSPLRSWLNDSFYVTAFNSDEQKSIIGQILENEENNTNDTTDNVYLLSYREVTNDVYGFCNGRLIGSDSRRMKVSDYAYVRGVWRSHEGQTDTKEGKCYWWLRTQDSNKGETIDSGSVANQYYGSVADKHDRGVVPAIHIELSSGLFSMTDDKTSGSGGEDSTDGKDSTGDKADGGSGNNSQAAGRVSRITVSGISGKIAAGKKVRLSAEVFPANAKDKTVIWKSSNPKYAAVDVNGVVRTKKAGAGKTVTITALAKDGSGIWAAYKIRLMKHAVKKVKITASSKSVKAGKTIRLKAVVTTTGKNANKKLKWTSSNGSYATVSSKGIVKALKSGKGKTVTITASATDGSGKKAKIKIKIK